jgi:site-specific recombinase XerD
VASQLISRDDLERFPPIAIEFQHTMTGVYGRSDKTIFEYLLDLRLFFKFLAAQDAGLDPASDDISNLDFAYIDVPRLAKVQQRDIIAYLYFLTQSKGNAAVTRNRKLSAIRTFFKFLIRTGRLEDNPAENIAGPKKRATLPKFLTLDQSISFLDTVSRSDSSTKRRDYAILTLFLNCGMRLSELTGMNLTDISQDFRTIRVLGKGNKERMVYLNDACRYALIDYLQERLDGTPEKMRQKALFLSNRNQRISNKTVQWMVYKYLDAAGLHVSGMSVHKLRHTAATLMYQTGKVDVRVLKEILGHEQLNTTQIYTHVTNQNMEDAVGQNPLSTLKRASPVEDIVQRTREEWSESHTVEGEKK